MAHTKSCSGTVSFAGWTLVGAGCTYDSTATIDAQAITTTVSFNNTMTANQIAALYNSNRINNTTGIFTVSIVGNALEVTLTGVVLPSEAVGNFTVGLTTSSPFPCASFLAQLTSLVCSIIPTPKRKTNRKGALVRCPDEIIFKADTSHPQVKYCNQIYNFYGVDEQGLIHYIKSNSNISQRNTRNWWVVNI